MFVSRNELSTRCAVQEVGPYFRKRGGRVFYEINELAEWSLSRKSKSTAGYWYQQRKESPNAGPTFP